MTIYNQPDTTLIDELVQHTEVFMKLLYAGLDTEEEFRRCEERIKELQAEIKCRQAKYPNNISVSPLSLPFTLRRK